MSFLESITETYSLKQIFLCFLKSVRDLAVARRLDNDVKHLLRCETGREESSHKPHGFAQVHSYKDRADNFYPQLISHPESTSITGIPVIPSKKSDACYYDWCRPPIMLHKIPEPEEHARHYSHISARAYLHKDLTQCRQDIKCES